MKTKPKRCVVCNTELVECQPFQAPASDTREPHQPTDKPPAYKPVSTKAICPRCKIRYK